MEERSRGAPRRRRRHRLHRRRPRPLRPARGRPRRRRRRPRRPRAPRRPRPSSAPSARSPAPRSSCRPTTSTSSTSARRTTCTCRSPRPRWPPASTSSARSRSRSTPRARAALVDAAAAAGRVAAVPFVYRYYPTVREARERVRSGATGPIRLIHGTYLQDWLLRAEDDNWRVDAELGGASRTFADIGSHWCDLAEFVTGHRITRLSARMLTALPQRLHAENRPAFSAAPTDGEVRDGRHRGRRGRAVRDRPGRDRHDGRQPDLGRPQEPPVARGRRRRGGAGLRPGGAGDAVGRPPRGRHADPPRPRAPVAAAPRAWRTLPPGHPQGYADCFDLFVADVYAAIRGDAARRGAEFADGLRAAQITDAVLALLARGALGRRRRAEPLGVAR